MKVLYRIYLSVFELYGFLFWGDEDWCATDVGRVNVNVTVKVCVDQGVRSCNNMIGFERGFILFTLCKTCISFVLSCFYIY